MKITGVILAAGTSSRMGQTNKLFLEYRNHTIIDEVVKQLSGSKVDNILIITGFEHTQVEILLTNRLTDRIRVVYNDNYRLGRAESIKCAINRIKGHADAALFMVADKPEVSTDLINMAIEKYRENQPPILYVETPAGRGHPIIFSSALFEELLQFEGDLVGNELIEKYKNDLVRIFDDRQQIDIDNEDDYRRLLKSEIGNQPQ